MYKENGIWYVYGGGLTGKTLAQAVRWGYGWYLLEHHMMSDQQEEHDAIRAEIARQAGPKTFVEWCPRCQLTTHHRLDTGCVECLGQSGR